MSGTALFIAVFLACIVEAVEATTIVLAAGTARNWRSALMGSGVGLLVLALIIAIAGPAISALPLGVLRLAVGGLLLVFGLQWLRKAILRASGYKALHDEELIFQNEVADARTAGAGGRGLISDWYAFTLSFKGVLLEGLEVAFIVLTFGTVQNQVPLAALAGVIAVLLVVAAGFAVRKPLARVPENTMKFVVGVMLTAFGIFWGVEGAGGNWPGADLVLLVLAPLVAVLCLAIVAVLRGKRARETAAVASAANVTGTQSAAGTPVAATAAEPAAEASPLLTEEQLVEQELEVASTRRTAGQRLSAFGMFWYDFIVGDDWRVAAGIVVAFLITFAISSAGIVAWWVVPTAVLLLLPFSLVRLTRSAH